MRDSPTWLRWKKMEKTREISRWIKPIVLASHICGIAYFRENLGNKWIALHRFFVVALWTACLVHEIPSITFWIVRSTSLHAILATFETSLRWFLLFFNNVFTAVRNKRIVEVVYDLSSLNLDLGKTSIKELYKIQILIISFNLAVVSGYMILGHHFIWYNINVRWYTAIIYIFTEHYINLGNMQFASICYCFRQCFKGINEKMYAIKNDLKTRNTGGNYFARQITENRRLHLTLSRLAEKLNTCYSLQVGDREIPRQKKQIKTDSNNLIFFFPGPFLRPFGIRGNYLFDAFLFFAHSRKNAFASLVRQARLSFRPHGFLGRLLFLRSSPDRFILRRRSKRGPK